MYPSLDTIDDAAFARLSRQLTPAAFYVRVDDNIRVTSYNAAAGVTLACRGRVLTCDEGVKPSADTQTPNTDRTAKTTIVRTAEGWLLGGQVFVTAGAPLVGQCFVVVELVQGESTAALALQTLAAGYVTAKQPLNWPGQPIGNSLDGAGALRAIAGTTPGAGTEFTETVPTGARWELLAFNATLVTAAAVANRVPIIIIDDGANLLWDYITPGNETASLSWTNNWAPGVNPVFTAANNTFVGPLPIGLRLLAGHRIRSLTVAIQGADQYASPKYLVREFLEGA